MEEKEEEEKKKEIIKAEEIKVGSRKTVRRNVN